MTRTAIRGGLVTQRRGLTTRLTLEACVALFIFLGVTFLGHVVIWTVAGLGFHLGEGARLLTFAIAGILSAIAVIRMELDRRETVAREQRNEDLEHPR